jgi:hypothetical protein
MNEHGASAFGCHDVRELAPDLALGTLSGGERAEALLHINGCARCQAFVAELTDVADHLPLLAPEIEPPPGFGAATVALMTGARPRRRFRFAAAIAAAAAAAAILSVTIVRITDDTTSRTTAAPPPASAPTLRSVDMIGANGNNAGEVYIAGDRVATMRIELAYVVPNGAYAIRLTGADGTGTQIGTVGVDGWHGKWSGPVRLPHGAATVALVDATGKTVCTASVGTATVSST